LAFPVGRLKKAARYYDSLNGLFNQIDPFAGSNEDPQSLHKYLYCHANPVNGIDPTGEFGDFSISGIMTNMTISMAITQISSPLIEYASGKLGFAAKILEKLFKKMVNPSAFMGGIGGTARVGKGSIGIGLQGNAEVLWSPKTHNAAFYTAFGLSGGLSGAGVMGSAYGGLVYGAKTSSNYEGGFITFSLPIRLIPQRIYGRIQSDLTAMLARNIIIKDPTGLDEEMWMRANRTIHDNIKRLCRTLKNSAQFEINVFADNIMSPKVGGFSIGVSGGVMTQPGKGLSASVTRYTQIWPSGPVRFE
jgi:RHS repeat-associated protein